MKKAMQAILAALMVTLGALGCASCSNLPPSPTHLSNLSERIEGYPYKRIRPKLMTMSTHDQVFARATMSREDQRAHYMDETDFFNAVNFDHAKEVSVKWGELDVGLMRVGYGVPATDVGSLEGSGYRFRTYLFADIIKGPGKLTTIEWWERGTVYPTWYPASRRTNPKRWQNVIQATERTEYHNFFPDYNLNRKDYERRNFEKGETVMQLRFELMCAHLIGQNLRASEPNGDFGVKELTTNSRRTTQDGGAIIRPAIVSDIVIVLRSGLAGNDRVIALKFITEFEADAHSTEEEVRHHWCGVKLFNGGQTVESLRSLSSLTDEQGVPGNADPESERLLTSIAESDGWLVEGPSGEYFETKFRSNGEPIEWSPALEETFLDSRGGWLSVRVTRQR